MTIAGLVTVFGGSGFIGEQVVRALARGGRRVRAAVRQPGRGYRLPMLGDVGQIEVVQADIAEEASVRRALAGAEGCVNAVGILQPSRRRGFADIHVDGARRVALAARAEGASAFVHLSALGADAASPSAYARSKAEGEAAVRDAFAGAAILRPSLVFGPRDAFFNRFAQMALMSPALPLFGGGRTLFQPVFVGDVARLTAMLAASPGAPQAAIELGGPETASFRALMERLLAVIGRSRLLVAVPSVVASAIAAAGDLAAGFGLPAPITSDQLRLLARDSIVAPGAPGLADFAITATAMEAILPTYLWRYRRGGQYAAMGPPAAQAIGGAPT